MLNRVKIVATIGPASQDKETLKALILAGMDVARLNFSHGDHENHRRVFQNLRELSEELRLPVTILQDIQGPKIRTGEIAGGKMELTAGQAFALTTREVLGNNEIVSVDFSGLPECAIPGSRILLDDGNLELMVVERSKTDPCQVLTRVVLGGTLKPHKGVNLPGVRLEMPALTEKDVADLIFGLELGVDALAVSFVRSEVDIQQVRKTIEQHAPDRRQPLVIAKLERPEALEHLEAILQAADGVMVARGDLGVEMPPEMVPIAQKRIIETANRKAKIVVTATQMLESMIHQPRPTRAEASDVANAVFDGTDAVMLSGETAVGKYPAETVRMMASIIQQAEQHNSQWGRWTGLSEPGECDDDTYYMTRAATELAGDRNVAALAAFTESGRTACMLSKERPAVPILACTPDEVTYHRMNLYWGVIPIRVARVNSIDEMIKTVEKALLETRQVKPGQQTIFTFGYPIQKGRPTNTAYLHTIGE